MFQKWNVLNGDKSRMPNEEKERGGGGGGEGATHGTQDSKSERPLESDEWRRLPKAKTFYASNTWEIDHLCALSALFFFAAVIWDLCSEQRVQTMHSECKSNWNSKLQRTRIARKNLFAWPSMRMQIAIGGAKISALPNVALLLVLCSGHPLPFSGHSWMEDMTSKRFHNAYNFSALCC